MYLTKLISITLAATVATVAAAPSQLQQRQSSTCQQALAELSQASTYYKSVGAQWTGSAANALVMELRKLDSAAKSIGQTCAAIDQAITSAGQSYSSAESQNSNIWQ